MVRASGAALRALHVRLTYYVLICNGWDQICGEKNIPRHVEVLDKSLTVIQARFRVDVRNGKQQQQQVFNLKQPENAHVNH